MKKISFPRKTFEQTIYIECNTYCSLRELMDKVPEGIKSDDVYIDTVIESGYYGSESVRLSMYYKTEVDNANYEIELKEYNKYLAIEKYYEEHCKDYFKVYDIIQLPIGQVIFLDKIELAPLKKITWIRIFNVLPPLSPDHNDMTDTNWCQVVYFNIDGKDFNTILFSKDVLLREKYVDDLNKP